MRNALRNKMMLGGLTVADLLKIVKIRGEFSIGQNWLPISRARVRDGKLGIFMQDIGSDADVEIPTDRLVKVCRGIATILADPDEVLGGFMLPKKPLEVRIKLHEDPFPETIRR